MGSTTEINSFGKGSENGTGIIVRQIPAIKKDDALVAEMDSYIRDKTSFHLWWLGQSGFMLQWKGQRVLLDPYLSDSLTRKYADTPKPHVRMSERVVDPELLRDIMVVTSSHNHTDHLDAETLIPIIRNNPGTTFIIPEANRDFASERVKCEKSFPVGLTDGKIAAVGDFTFLGIPAKHNEIERDTKGNCKFMGYLILFDKFKIYHSGDTLWFEGMVDLLEPFSIDVAILPINGSDPSRKVAGNLNCKEAAELGLSIHAGCVIPCHYDMFTFNTADVHEFVLEAEKIHQPYQVLQGGSKFSIPVAGTGLI
jgi:L-ascorbate metabolism protein UlaG (beta-lactamase superfamily)